MKRTLILLAFIALAGCSDSPQEKQADLKRQLRQEETMRAYNNMKDLSPVETWKTPMNSYIEVFKDPTTRCEYLIINSKAVVPRMQDKDLSGTGSQVCS